MVSTAELISIKQTLEYSELFCGLSSEQLDKLVSLCQEESYKAGEIIFLEGVSCDSVYIVKSGKVTLEVHVRIGRGAEGSATIDVITRGGCLGWSPLINPDNIFTATSRCIEETKVIRLNAAKLKKLFEDDREMGHNVMFNLAKVVSLRLQGIKQTVGRILSIIFHDLKAPLAAVENYNRLLLGDFVGQLNEEQKDMIERSSKRLTELLNLVTNMIDLSRIDFGDLRKEKVSLLKVIEFCIEIMSPLAEKKGLQLLVEMPKKFPAILGTQERLQQVVTNLLSNAIKYTHSGGVITVRAKDDTYYIQVEVIDTGIGIPSEELPTIFDGLYRGLDVAERGTGLGLSISKKIVLAHRGRIWAVSPCPETNKGSKFIFTLPKIGERSEKKIRQVSR